MKRFFYVILCLVLSAALSGCAAFSNYTRDTEKARISISQGNFQQALKEFPESKAKSGNEILIRMERGTLLQATGDFQFSTKEFELAAGLIKEQENKAVISASEAAYQTASLLVNEKVIPYEGQNFEKVMVHTLDALNYLMMGNTEDARVEIRNSYRVQQDLYNKHYKDIEKAKKDSQGMNYEDSFKTSGSDSYNRMKETASSVVSIYQNAFAYYISSLVYELNGEEDEAYIDLKKAILSAPNCVALQRDLIRMSRDLGYRDDLDRWQNRFGRFTPLPKDSVDIFVIFELGLAPYREEFKLVLPIPSVGLVSVAVPVYAYIPSLVTGGFITAGGLSDETSIVSDTDAIASRNLLDDYPILLAKQAVRAALKGTATREAGKQYGGWAQLAAGVAFAITEQADLRTWSTLPKQIHVARLFVPRGTDELTVTALPGVPGKFSEKIKIPPNARHVVVLARATDSNITVSSKSY
ncbi:MAG TPA: hypothetical protein VIS94_14190 [Desulfomonilia bacterium]